MLRVLRAESGRSPCRDAEIWNTHRSQQEHLTSIQQQLRVFSLRSVLISRMPDLTTRLCHSVRATSTPARQAAC